MLTDAKVRNAKPDKRPVKLADSDGLHLFITPKGHKGWRYRTEAGGKERLMTLGSYPAMSLRQARDARDRIRLTLRDGGQPEPAVPAAPPKTLAELVDEWHQTNLPRWKPHHAAEVLSRLQDEILNVRVEDVPKPLGEMPATAITAPMLLFALRQVEQRGAVDTAHRLRGHLAGVYAFGIAGGACTGNPAASLKGAMTTFIPKGHRPAVTEIDAARDVLKRAESIPALPVTRLAMRFLALTAQRPGEVGGARWIELSGLDGTEPTWIIPAERMKSTRERAAEVEDHHVPLSRQAIETIEAVRLLTGRMPFLFPSARSAHEPMSENALGLLLRRAGLGGVHVPHGWRASFSTIMNERHREDQSIIDQMLAHTPKDQVQAAYNRARHLRRRRELAQIWADLLVEGLPPASVLVGMRRK